MEKSLDQILNLVTSNPELMSKISSIASSGSENAIGDVVSLISPLIKNQDNVSFDTENESEEPEIDSISSEEKNSSESRVSTISASFEKSIAKSKDLLLALKPYLSKERCNMIDNVIRLSQIANVIKMI